MINKHHKFMWKFSKRVLLGIRRPVFIYLTTLAFTLQFIFAALFYWAEYSENSGLMTFFDALYFATTVMTGVGLGDIVPVTIVGRVISMLMMLAGTAIFVCFTGVLAASILNVEADQLELANQSKKHSSK